MVDVKVLIKYSPCYNPGKARLLQLTHAAIAGNTNRQSWEIMKRQTVEWWQTRPYEADAATALTELFLVENLEKAQH